MIKIGYNNGTVIDTIHQAVILGGCMCEKLEARTEKEPLGGLAGGPEPREKFGASAWHEKNVCADDGGTSIAPPVGSQINQPCESRHVGINKDSQSDLSSHQQLLTELTSSTQTKNCSVPTPHKIAEVPIPLHKMENSKDDREGWKMLPILLYQGHTIAEVRRTNEIIGIMCHRSAPELMAKLVQLDNEERILLDGIGAKELHDMLLATYPTMTVSYNAFREAFRLAG